MKNDAFIAIDYMSNTCYDSNFRQDTTANAAPTIPPNQTNESTQDETFPVAVKKTYDLTLTETSHTHTDIKQEPNA